MKTYKVDILIPIQNTLIPGPPATPGAPPSNFKPFFRIPKDEVAHCEGLKVYMGKAKNNLKATSYGFPSNYELFQLTYLLNANNWIEVVENSKNQIENIVDNLSFQIQEALTIVSVDMVDVSAPIINGESREWINIGDPKSIFQPFKYSNTTSFNHSQYIPTLKNYVEVSDRKWKVILWWYLISLNSTTLIERISSIFIVLDNISKPHKSGAYKSSCGHLIEKCPICSVNTKRTLIGDSIKDFLKSKGFNATEVKELWDMRQVVHGNDIYTHDEMFDHSTVINKLIGMLYVEIKDKLGLKSIPKLVSKVTMSPSVVPTGVRNIHDDDIIILDFLNK